MDTPHIFLETADEIAALDDRKIVEFYVKTWDRWVHLLPISGKDREDLLEIQGVKDVGGNARVRNFRARLVSLSLVNSHGIPLYTSREVDRLTEKNDAALAELSEACSDLSKLKPEDVDELVGGLPNAASEDSGAA
jgi:hypothetical protein